MTIVCRYRIYPLWFVEANPAVPMRELADGSAEEMGRVVETIEPIDSGFDHRGWFMDFNVTYSSTAAFYEWRRL